MITNDVYADIKNKIYKKMNNSFNGTLFYFELTNNGDKNEKDK